MKKEMVIVLAILIAVTFTLTTTKKAEADITLFIGPLIPVVMIIGDLVLYFKHPECRKADTMGALGECVQKAGTSEQEKVEVTTEKK